MAIGVNDPVSAFRDASIEWRACQPSIDFMAGCVERGLTVREMVHEMRQIDPDWCLFFRQRLASLLTPATKLLLVVAAVEGRPELARIAELHASYLSDAELKYLNGLWSPDDFPRIRAEIQDGRIRRRVRA